MNKAFEATQRAGPSFCSSADRGSIIDLLTMLVTGITPPTSAVVQWQKDAQLRQSLEQQRVSSELWVRNWKKSTHRLQAAQHHPYATAGARAAIHRLSRAATCSDNMGPYR
jgi:hypothetical protein